MTSSVKDEQCKGCNISPNTKTGEVKVMLKILLIMLNNLIGHCGLEEKHHVSTVMQTSLFCLLFNRLVR